MTKSQNLSDYVYLAEASYADFSTARRSKRRLG